MRVLVTGAGGYVGNWLVNRLAAAGHDVVAHYHRQAHRLAPATADRVSLWQCDLARGDISGPAVDTIIHTAAAQPTRKGLSAADYAATNTMIARNLIAYARARGVRLLIHTSTVSVYGLVTEPVVMEDAPLRAPDAYGASKYLAELLLQDAAEEVPGVSIRLPGIVGPGYTMSWLGRTVQKAIAGEEIAFYNPDSPFNNVAAIEEVGDFIQFLLARTLQGHQVVNLAASDPVPMAEAIDVICSSVGSNPMRTPSDRPGGSFAIGIDRLTSEFGYTPRPAREVIGAFAAATAAFAEMNAERQAAMLSGQPVGGSQP